MKGLESVRRVNVVEEASVKVRTSLTALHCHYCKSERGRQLSGQSPVCDEDGWMSGLEMDVSEKLERQVELCG